MPVGNAGNGDRLGLEERSGWKQELCTNQISLSHPSHNGRRWEQQPRRVVPVGFCSTSRG